jgi:restriction system protein
MWPTLEALKALGGSATIREIYEKVVELEHFTEEQQSVRHRHYSEIEYRLAWARSYLKSVGALDNSSRGVWSITDKGRHLTQADMARIPAQVRAMRPTLKRADRSLKPVPSHTKDVEEEEEEEEEVDWVRLSWRESEAGDVGVVRSRTTRC